MAAVKHGSDVAEEIHASGAETTIFSAITVLPEGVVVSKHPRSEVETVISVLTGRFLLLEMKAASKFVLR